MNTNLFKAILAMDSYNRGYDAGIKFGNLPGNFSIDTQGTQLGNATIYRNKGDGDAQAIGFYGIAYTYGAEKIISYRGTDDFNNVTDLLTSKDVFYGWTMGAANSNAAQATMALQFYNTVAGNPLDTRTPSISFTGHSLGGGLTNCVSAVFDASV